MVHSRKPLNQLFGLKGGEYVGFLGRPTIILSIYVAFLAVKLFSVYQSSDYPAELGKVHYIGFVPVVLLSLLAAKGWRAALWIMASTDGAYWGRCNRHLPDRVAAIHP